MACYDSLTSLSNRRIFVDRLRKTIQNDLRTVALSALLFIDLDGLKEVNDTLVHDAGDQLLIQITDRLRNHSRKSDTVARTGGDEFTMILVDIKSISTAEKVARKINEILAAPWPRWMAQIKNPF